jgi:hypothetical protein
MPSLGQLGAGCPKITPPGEEIDPALTIRARQRGSGRPLWCTPFGSYQAPDHGPSIEVAVISPVAPEQYAHDGSDISAS